MNEVRPSMPGLPNGVPNGSTKPDNALGQRDKNGMALNQKAALASLDPRISAQQQSNRKLGITTHVANGSPRDTPDQGIAVSRDYRQESDHSKV